MNETLKGVAHIGAELAAAKADLQREMERHRKTWRQLEQVQRERIDPFSVAEAIRKALDRNSCPNVFLVIAYEAAIEALSLQAEPAPEPREKRARPGYLDQAVIDRVAESSARHLEEISRRLAEQSPAQDEREVAAVIGFYEGEREPRLLSWNVLPNGEHRLYTRPAQIEQQPTVKDSLTVQPMAYAVFAANGNVACFSTQRDHQSIVALEADGHSVVSLTSIAQTAPQPEQSGTFAMHQQVRKISGSEWEGHICGTYSTELTPEGYAVESSAHRGSVQIYPATALELVPIHE